MYATEFQTVINEPFIKIPDYEFFKGHKVRITLLDIDNKNSNSKLDNKEAFDFIEYYANHPKRLDNDVVFLTREEANER